MNIRVFPLGLVLLASIPVAHSEPVHDRTHGPCFSVIIQNDRTNEASVEQNCDRNFSRTVQAGRYNSAHTLQTGRVNNNKVRQYSYDASPRQVDRKRDN